jgi:hypothetical protein
MRHAKLYGFTILSIDIVPKLFSYEVPTRLLEDVYGPVILRCRGTRPLSESII